MELVGVLLLVYLQGVLLTPSPTPHTCPLACLCLRGSHVNCSSAGLSSTPLDLQENTAVLDLSHNVLTTVSHLGHEYEPLYQLTHLLLGHNHLAGLSLCLLPASDVAHDHLLHPLPCESWAPNLWLLSLEWNQLQAIPEGLLGSSFLEVLNLSYNKINAVQEHSLNGCTQLRELYLQHNNISSLHPLAFQHTVKLQVLDLSFNALGTIGMTAYLSFRSLNAWLDVQGNLWRCDCDLRTLKRWMSFDRDWSRLSWKVVCEEPPQLAGRDLMLVDEAELTCVTVTSNAKCYREVTVDLGADFLLPCDRKKWDTVLIYWWTPHGVLESTDGWGGLLLRNIGMHDEGLYACTSGETQRLASVFDVQVHKGTLGVQRIIREIKEWDHSEFVQAVCLSVFITFIGAFILGVLARPLLDVLWKRICVRQPLTGSPNPCENMSYSVDEEEDDQGRRVSDSERASEPYYITILPNSDGASPEPECSAAATITPKNGEGSIDAGPTYENISVVGKGSPPELNQEPHNEDDEKSDNSITEITLTDNDYNIDTEVNLDPVNMTEPDEVHRVDQHNQLFNTYFKGELEVDWFDNNNEQEEDQITDNDHGKANTWNPCPVQMSEPIVSPRPSPESFTDNAASVTPNLLDPNLDPEFWNDRGESFEFSDSGKDLSQFTLAIQAKTDPWTMHRDLTLDHTQESRGLHGAQDENSNHVLSYRDSTHKYTYQVTDPVVKLEQVSLSPESLQSHHHHDNDDEPTDHTLCKKHGDEAKRQITSDELSNEPADHTQSYELRDEIGYTLKCELNDKPTGHTLTYELNDESIGHTVTCELNDEPTGPTLTCELNDEPTGPTLTYELNDKPTGHTLTYELNDESTGHTVTCELNDEPTGPTLTCEHNDEPTGSTLTYELNDEPTGPTLTYELNDEPTGLTLTYELNDKPIGPTLTLELNDKPIGPTLTLELNDEPTGPTLTCDLNDEPTGPTLTCELNDKPTGLTLTYELNDKPTGPTLTCELNDKPTGLTLIYELNNKPTGPTLTYEHDDGPTGYAQSYELDDEHIEHTPINKLRNELMGYSPDQKVFCNDSFCLHPQDGTDPVVQFARKCDNLKSPAKYSHSSIDTEIELMENTVLRELNRMDSPGEPELNKTSFSHDNTIEKHPDTLSDISVTPTFEEMPNMSLEKHKDHHFNCSPGSLGSEWTMFDSTSAKPRGQWSEGIPQDAPCDSAADTISGRGTSVGESREIPVVYNSEEPQPQVWTDVTPPSPTTEDSGDWSQKPWEISQLQTTRRPFLLTANPYTPIPIKPRRSSYLSQEPIVKDTTKEEAAVQEESVQGTQRQDWKAGALFLQGWRTTKISSKHSGGIMGEDLTSIHTTSWRHRATVVRDLHKRAEESYNDPHLSDTQDHGEAQGSHDFSFTLSRSGAKSTQLFDIDYNQGSEA